MRHQIVLIGVTLGGLLLFQNCSDVGFDSSASSSKVTDLDFDHPPICNPLDGIPCDPSSTQGLKGNLYYMTEADHASLFIGGLAATVVDEYINLGVRVMNPVLMSQVNISPRGWESGFIAANGQIVKDNAGGTLLEWFALDLSGYIELPAGEWQLAQIADDGMRVSVEGTVVLNDDGVHSPRWQCSALVVSGGAKKALNVRYFQGPRTQISMQLLMRPAADASLPCDATGGWSEIPSQAFSH